MVITEEVKNLLPYLIFLVFLIFPFGQLFRLEVLPGVSLHLLDTSVGAVVSLWLLQVIRGQKTTLDYNLRLLLSFLGIALFTFLLGATRFEPQSILESALYLLRFGLYIGFLFALYEFVKTKETREIVMGGMLFAGLLTLFFGLFQYFFYPDLRALAVLGWDEHYYRLAGTFLDPGFTGVILVLFFLFILASKDLGVGFKYLLCLVLVFAVALTFSRASYLSLIVGLLLFSYLEKRVIVPFFLLGFFVLTVVFAPKPGGEGVNLGRSSTLFARLQNYENAEKLIFRNPLFGVGFNFLGHYQVSGLHSRHGVDSSVLFVAATTGIAGLAAFLFWYFNLSLSALSARSGLLSSSLASLFVHSLFQNTLFYPWILVWLFSLITLFKVRK